jgi:hypothetical protein
MRILIDANVVLDMPMARRPHVDHAVAVVAGVDAIVSRDGAGFAAASVPVFTPAAFLAAVRGELR